MTRVVLQYFDGCPNWETTDQHLAILVSEGWDVIVEHELIDSHQTALQRGFKGSPTVLVDGVDPFRHESAQLGLACRRYDTEHGPAGSPTLTQLRGAIIGESDKAARE